jgi:hypothetical protein
LDGLILKGRRRPAEAACRRVKRVALLLLFAAGAHAAELQIRFNALERMLAEQAFTEEGRRYVKGDKKTKCNFAYLEAPRVTGESGRLRIQARFTGRSALNMFGQCVGLGDAFNVAITAAPLFKDGNLRLAEVKVGSDKNGFYIRRVCNAMTESLTRDFKYPLAGIARAQLEDPGQQPAYKREVRRFEVTALRVSADSLVLVIDFDLIVK